MLNSPVVETILSLTLLMLFFSVLVSCVQEGYVALRQSRGKLLEHALKEVLDDQFNKNFAYLLYQHPQIDLLKKKQGDLPSYIGGETFAKALIDLIARESTETVYTETEDKKVMIKSERLKPEAVQHQMTLYAQNPEKYRMPAEKLVQQDPHTIPLEDRFRVGVELLNHSDLKNLLLSFDANTPLVRNEGAYLVALQSEIQKWFDAYMGRVTGWYKRQIRTNLFFASMVVTVALNLNFITLSKTIYADSKLRDTMTDMAIRVGSQEKAIDSIRQVFIDTRMPAQDIDFEAIIGTELPIGWKDVDIRQSSKKATALGRLIDHLWTLFKDNFLGWALFTLGLSLGAPFWFDVLKKFVNVRNAGTKPQS